MGNVRKREGAFIISALSAVITGLGCPTIVHAQAVARSSDTLLDDVVVTARRRNERLQDVPIAVTVLSSVALERARVDRLDEVQRLVPGFSVTPTVAGSGALNPTIRSQRQALPNMVFDLSVNTYISEVVAARPQGLNTGLFDIESLQVLKGPQGTLFGRNSTGGALIITPKQPGESFEGYIRGTLGNYDLRQGEAVVNVPINDNLQVRLGGKITRRDGYVHSYTTGLDFDDERSEAWRVSLRFVAPNDKFRTLLVIDGTHESDNGTAYKATDVYATGSTLQAIARTTLLPIVQADGVALQSLPFHSTFSNASGNGVEIHTYGLSHVTEIELNDNLKIKNILGYRYVDSFLYFDLDGSRVNAIDSTQHVKASQNTEEFQVLGTADSGRLDYIAGLFLFDEKGSDLQISRQFIGTPIGLVGTKNPYMRNKSAALFAQVTYRPEFLDNVSVTGGLRSTWDSRRVIGNSTSRPVATGITNCTLLTADVGGVPLSPCNRAVSKSFSALTYTATLDWKPAPDTLIYLTNSTGYRTGGFQASAVRPSDFLPYNPEKVKNYEIGLKSAWSIGGTKGWTSIAAYYQKYKEIQRQITLVNNTGALISNIANAASGTIKGGEIEVIWQPTRRVDVSLSYAYSDPKYNEFKFRNAAGLQDYTKSRFAGAPKHMVGGSVRWNFLHIREGEFSAQVAGSYISSRAAGDVSSFDPVTQTDIQSAILPGNHTFDARLDWTRMFGREISLGVWVKNLTNEHYYTSFPVGQSLGVRTATLGAPRTYGATLQYEF